MTSLGPSAFVLVSLLLTRPSFGAGAPRDASPGAGPSTAPDASVPSPDAATRAASTSVRPVPPSPPPAPTAVPLTALPADGPSFAASLQILFRAVACEGEAPLPTTLTVEVHTAHCAALRRQEAYYKRHWLKTAAPFLARVVPANVSPDVLYPFGGGDLVSALATFPAAETVTSISLETAGDVRRFQALDTEGWRLALADVRLNLQHLFAVSHSKTVNLRRGAKAALPTEVVFALVALAIHEQEPVDVRYFHWGPDGTLAYFSNEELAATKNEGDFAHVEVSFRPKAPTPAPSSPAPPGEAPLRHYRHIAANLDDAHLKDDAGLEKLMAGARRPAVLVKAASYLLWSPAFTRIRGFLLETSDWMISDSTGVPASIARAAGFVQEVWGEFHGTFFPANAARTKEMVALWQTAPLRRLPIMFGYPDNDEHAHMMVTRRAPVGSVLPAIPLPMDYPAGGAHWRFTTAHGPVHVWRPRHLDPARAGWVVYVHGLFTSADQAFARHRLAEQFAASHLDAIFIVPEAPVAATEEVRWASLRELRDTVAAAVPGLPLEGPLGLIGHSAAYRTLAGWLDEPEVNSLILLDAFYGHQDRFEAWLARVGKEAGAHLTVVTRDTAKNANAFLSLHPEAVRLGKVPRRWEELPRRARDASVLELRAQWGHMQVVTSGRVIPVVLRRMPIELLSEARVRPPGLFLQSSSREPAPRPPSTAMTLPVT